MYFMISGFIQSNDETCNYQLLHHSNMIRYKTNLDFSHKIQKLRIISNIPLNVLTLLKFFNLDISSKMPNS